MQGCAKEYWARRGRVEPYQTNTDGTREQKSPDTRNHIISSNTTRPSYTRLFQEPSSFYCCYSSNGTYHHPSGERTEQQLLLLLWKTPRGGILFLKTHNKAFSGFILHIILCIIGYYVERRGTFFFCTQYNYYYNNNKNCYYYYSILLQIDQYNGFYY